LVQYGNVLKKEVYRSLFQYVVKNEKMFVDAEVVNSYSPEEYKDWRKSKVLYDSDLKEYVPYFKNIIKKKFGEVCQCLNIKPFEIHSLDIQVTSHNDGDQFKLHQDKDEVHDVTEDRMITFVYYFHSPVKKFNGGELLFPGNGRMIVEPVNNTIIFFNPILVHQVLPVSCPDKKFRSGRFSVNGWVLKKPNHRKTSARKRIN
jgi:SM-20-related protein